MSTLKLLAFELQRHLQLSVSSDLPRSHVHELLAACCGFGSWSALNSNGLLADGEAIGEVLPAKVPNISGRAVQLGYSASDALALGESLRQEVLRRSLRWITWTNLEKSLRPHLRSPLANDEQEDTEDWELDDDFEDERPGGHVAALLESALLLSTLTARANARPELHYWLAAIHRCRQPSPYLWEQQQAGRQLNAAERAFVAEYLALKPQHEAYRCHLRAAAEAALPAAALEWAEVFEDPSYLHVFRSAGSPAQLVAVAALTTDQYERTQLLKRAAAQQHPSALRQLAESGDRDAMRELAEHGDRVWLIRLATEAVDAGDGEQAWQWQFVAQHHGHDLTDGHAEAFHEGGLYANQRYDDDQGGPLYVLEDNSVTLPEISEQAKVRARAHAAKIEAAGAWDQ